jgi:hypothetical protein
MLPKLIKLDVPTDTTLLPDHSKIQGSRRDDSMLRTEQFFFDSEPLVASLHQVLDHGYTLLQPERLADQLLDAVLQVLVGSNEGAIRDVNRLGGLIYLFCVCHALLICFGYPRRISLKLSWCFNTPSIDSSQSRFPSGSYNPRAYRQ